MHFTYCEPDRRLLRQGDILKKTPELLALIEKVHPHYANSDYLYFQVLTQSCDLVVRDGACKTRYITLAAVRALDLVVQRAINEFADKETFQGKLVCSERHKLALTDLFQKLFNNNDTQHFFLQAAPEFGLEIDCCTQLHLSISIRAYEHFDLCLKAKILELRESFRAKLGWLVGNLYSRVGTEDYVPGAIPDAETFNAFVINRMENYVVWVPESDFPTFKKAAKHVETFDALQKRLTEERERKRETQLSQLVATVAKTFSFDNDQKQLLKNVLAQQPLVKKALSK